jgi:FkbM family methyltransferase
VGANEGQYGKSLRKLGFSGYIFSFEPVAETYSKLKAEAESDPRWRVYNFALGSENCVKEINVFGASVFNSFLCPAATPKDVYSHPDFNTFNHQMVSVKTLDSVYDEVVEQIEDECRPFIKLDTQGFDLEVVKGGKAVLGKMLGLQVELSFVPIYDEMPDYVSSLKTFELLGFHVTNFFPVSNELPPIEFDCVMIAAKAFQQNKTKQG